MILLYIKLVCLVVATRGSVVVDKQTQNTLQVSEFCSKTSSCPEGSHIMCISSVHSMGPACSSDAHSVYPSSYFVETLLHLINDMRKKLSMGAEIGIDKKPLPKAYGMQKLKWDVELAVFAQVWANQCRLRHDLCRATKDFPDPGQVNGMLRYSYPDWQLISGSGKTLSSVQNLTDDKVIHTMQKTIQNAYKKGKAVVSRDMIERFPKMTDLQEVGGARPYLIFVDARSTHVGCGISSYSDYNGKERNSYIIFKVVQIVCNFSGQPVVGEKVYETVKPVDPTFTPKCGCPPGYTEDVDCFCIEPKEEESKETTLDRMDYDFPTEPCPKPGNKCIPKVVLLPIFQMDDAPSNQLYSSGTLRSENLTSANLTSANPTSTNPTSANLISANLALALTSMNLSNIFTNASNLFGAVQDVVKNTIQLKESDLMMNNKLSESSYNKSINSENSTILPDPGAPDSKLVTPIKEPSTPKNKTILEKEKDELPVQNEHKDNVSSNSTQSKKVRPIKDFSKVKNVAAAYLEEKMRLQGLKYHKKLPAQFNNVRQLMHFIVPRSRKLEYLNETKNKNKTSKKGRTYKEILKNKMKPRKLNTDVENLVENIYSDLETTRLDNKSMSLKSERADILRNLLSYTETKTTSNTSLNENQHVVSLDHGYDNILFGHKSPSQSFSNVLLKRKLNDLFYVNRFQYTPFIKRLSALTGGNNIYDSFLERNRMRFRKDDDLKSLTEYQNLGKNFYVHDKFDMSGVDKFNYSQLEKGDDLKKKLQSRLHSKQQNKNKQAKWIVRPSVMRPTHITNTNPKKSRNTS